jgi:hypothetical protein
MSQTLLSAGVRWQPRPVELVEHACGGDLIANEGDIV